MEQVAWKYDSSVSIRYFTNYTGARGFVNNNKRWDFILEWKLKSVYEDKHPEKEADLIKSWGRNKETKILKSQDVNSACYNLVFFHKTALTCVKKRVRVQENLVI